MRISDDLEEMRLLPIHVEAAVFGSGRNVSMANINENYRSLLAAPAGDDMESKTFTGNNSPEEPGVHLHFILPEEFTHGSQQEEGGDIVYPDFPNRWTVTRIAVLESEGKEPVLTRKNWILESDLLSAFPDSDKQYTSIGYHDPKKPYRFLGKMRACDGVITSPGEHLPHLSAVSTGKPHFSGYYPECKNVLGCYDSLSDLEVKEGTEDFIRLTYIVCGWTENEDPKDHTVCHGIVTGIKWTGPSGSYETGLPSGTSMPNVAVGNSLEEAAAALGSYYLKQPEMEKVLKHLFFGTLSEWEKLDGALEGEKKIKQYQFLPEPSKEELKIQGKEAGCFREREEILYEIFRRRRHQEEYEEQIKEERQEIYLLWRKYAMDPKFLEKAKSGISQRMEAVTDLEKKRKHEEALEQEAVKKLRALLGDGEALIEAPGERYWRPRDLTFLLEGAGQSSIYKRLEEYKIDGKIPGRNRKDIISEVIVKISGVTEGEKVKISGEQLLEGTERIKEPVIEQLVREGALTARGCIFYTADKLLRRYKKQRDTRLMSHAVTAYEDCLNSRENLCGGTMASPIGNYVWSPAWNPLILEWSIKYYPDPKIKEGASGFENWRLKETDFDYEGETIGEEVFEPFTGRCILSPYGADYLSGMFKKYVSDEKYRDIGNKMAGMKILSQSLDGFHDKLITRKESVVVAPWMNRTLDQEITALTSRAIQGTELYEDLNQSKRNQRKPTEAFYPIRAGFGRIDRVRVIDSFGRVLKYDVGDVIVPENLRMGQDNPAPRFLLRPRILAPMRLRSRWIMQETGIGDEISPVFGWLWVNLLDSCLHIYHPDGTMAGSIQNTMRMDGSGIFEISLRNPPGQTGKEEEILDGMGPGLRGFAEGLLEAGRREPSTLPEFLKALDDSMWTSRSGGGTAQEQIQAGMGRPLALAGIEIKVEVKGSSPVPMIYDNSERAESLLDRLQIPLRIGDEVRQTDGTAGFYLHGEGGGFCVFHQCRSEKGTESRTAYLDQNTTLNMKTTKDALPTRLTVLFHPAGNISMTTGLLPVKEMKLSEAWTERAIENIYLTLYYGPFLTPQSQLQMFLPKAMEKEWSFLSFEKPGIKNEERDIKPPWMDMDQEEEWKQIKEGWLLLKAGAKEKG